MLLLAVLFLGIGVVTAQTRKVTGTVISAEDGQSVIGASVLVENTKINTICSSHTYKFVNIAKNNRVVENFLLIRIKERFI